MKAFLLAAALLSLLVAESPARNFTGDWAGSIDKGPSRFLLLLHIRESAGKLQATFDSPDQNVAGLRISSISQDGPDLKFASTAAHITYQGTATPDGGTIQGTWTQEQPRPLTWKRIVPSEFNGTWSGMLEYPAHYVRLAFNIEHTAEGFIAAVDSPDQHVSGIPVSITAVSGSHITIECSKVSGRFEGALSDDKSTIDGTWSQRSRATHLLLASAAHGATHARQRPQDPVKPYPYREEDVRFSNAAAGITLAGSLTIPPGNGSFPAVLLIGGSGPHNRYEEMMGHRPFLVLADYLTRKGIEVLCVDKRGVGDSGGSEAGATTRDFVRDAQSAVAFLRTRAEVNKKKIGLVGHSEGGLIAAEVAARDVRTAFIVMMAAPGVPGDQILPEQVRLLSEASGVPRDKAGKAAQEEADVIAMAEEEKDTAALRKEVEMRFAAEWPQSMLDKQVTGLSYPWTRYLLQYGPATALRHVTCPVLALAGSKDLQVPPAQNLQPIQKALREAGNRRVEIVEFPGLNHLFQPAQTGSTTEYARIDVTIAPSVLDRIAVWILRQ